MTPEQAELKAMGFEVPDSITPIVACRSWKISHGGLCSHNSVIWTPGKAMKAHCVHDSPNSNKYHLYLMDRRPPYRKDAKYLNPASVPLEVCTCGFYAAKHEEANRIVPRAPGYIYGEVYLWGKILEGPNGYRAEFAYPKRFFVADRTHKTKIEAMGFGVPVVLVGRIDGYRFPFPQGKTKNQMNRLYRSPLLPGLPALLLGVLDLLILDMSRALSQVLVAIQFSCGLAAATLGAYTVFLRRKMERTMGVSNVRVNGVPISVIGGYHRLWAIEKLKAGKRK